MEAKNKYITKDENEYPYGYVGFGKEILSAGKDAEEGRGDAHAAPDLKECFSIGPYNPAAGMPAIRWPCPPEDMEETWLAYYKEMERLSADLLRGFALALELPENWFEDKIDRHRCSMRALYVFLQQLALSDDSERKFDCLLHVNTFGSVLCIPACSGFH